MSSHGQASTEQKLRTYLKRVTADLQDTRQRLDEAQARQFEPVAVVGMACRYPGEVRSPEDLWELVATGRDAIGAFPQGRGWDLADLFDDDPDRAGTSYAREGGFVHDADLFDAEFFGISPREARAMDPQQRLLLEVSWELLERAGIDPAVLRGTQTGVYVGTAFPGFGTPHIERSVEGYLLTGNTPSVLSGRVAFTLGLEGPAVTIDTACSSSLVAIHLAMQALRQGECTRAVAGGVTVMTTPNLFTEFSRQRGLAPDGRCKPFSDAADGTAFAEGVGLVLLERLADAQRNGRRILAVLRGSAVNQDGASNGLTAPNGPSQRRVIRQALNNAGLGVTDVDAVEAHGTGTTLGDPIEAQALLATYGQGRLPDRPLWLGSVKSNIGHTQAAAGVAGVIKMVMAMRHGVLPASLHLQEPSRHVDWSAGAIQLLTEPTPWPRGDRPRRAAVSSFGISGTNAHLVVEEAVAATPEPTPAPEQSAVLPWVLSGRDEAALHARAAQLAGWAADRDPVQVGWSLATTRAHLEHRAVVVGTDREELLAGLDSLAAPGRVVAGELGPVLVFPGQGSQWLGMGVELLDQSPVFAARMVECERALSSYVDWSLVEVLRSGERLDRVDVVQPVLWAVMVSLAEVWRSYGVTPAAVVGHSQGEIAAACVAGALSLDDGARVVALRSRALRALAGSGAMASLAVPAGEVPSWLDGNPDVTVAAVNGPVSTVVSGPPEQVAAVVAACEAAGQRARLIDVDYASHGPQVEQLHGQLTAELAGVAPTTSSVAFYSSVTAGRIDTSGLDGAYWYTNLRQPVRFGQAVDALLAAGHRVFIEASPHPVLAVAVGESVERAGVDAAVVPTLRRDQGDLRQLTRAAGDAYTAGVPIDWRHWYPSDPTPTVVDLPTYPFQHQRYWLATAGGVTAPAGGFQPVGLPDGGLVLTGLVAAAGGWLAEHVVGGTPIVPGAAQVEWALRAGDEVGCPELEELTLRVPLALPASGVLRVQVVAGPAGATQRRDVRVWSKPEGSTADWVCHAEGTLAPEAGLPATTPATAWPPAGARPIDLDGFYDRLAAGGYGYGPAFRGLRAAWWDGTDLVAEVTLPEAAGPVDGYVIHPALLDAVLHPALLSLDTGDGQLWLPFAWSGVSLSAAGATAVRVRLTRTGTQELAVTVTDPEGVPVLTVGSLALRPARTDHLHAAGPARGALYTVDWLPHPGADSGTADTTHTTVGRHGDHPDLAALTSQIAGGAPAPALVVAHVESGTADPMVAVDRALRLVQDFLGESILDGSRLLLVTTRAVATADGEPVDPAAAAVWGLVRSAQLEHPDRLLILDLDTPDATPPGAALLASAEPQAALRGDRLLIPRLARAAAPAAPASAPEPHGTVLITGGTGTLGGQVAEHLATTWGVRHLVLVSRRGPDAPGATELAEHLTALGAHARIVAADAADPGAMAALVASIDPEQPLTGVVHAAGVLDDAVLTAQDRERLAIPWRAKAAAAAVLHEVTAGHPLRLFLMFSSASGILGSPGQANYAAANAYVDGLVAARRAAGRPGTSIAWGLWERATGMTGRMGHADRARLSGLGLRGLDDSRGLALLDEAATRPGGVLLAADLDPAGADAAPPILARLLGRRRRRTAAAGDGGGGLRARLAGLDEAGRLRVVDEVVRGVVAAVLGFGAVGSVGGGLSFRDLGFDSLLAVELRNRLGALTGLRLPSTVAFDYPSPAVLARFLLAELMGEPAPAMGSGPSVSVAAGDPVVVVGVACRFPGGVSSAEELWSLVASGRDAVGAFPSGRGWDLAALFEGDGAGAAPSVAREGGFLHEADRFDAGFFGMSPREALATDPQQRLLLEVAWELFEGAGVDPGSLRGSSTGVYAGVMYHDYAAGVAGRGGTEGYSLLASAGSVVSGRVAYAFGLEGPAVSVDTACSSSLVAVHLAAQALRQGECSMALAGGVTVMATPEVFTEFSRQGGLARDGRCKPFAAAADGTGWGEGVGLLLLERLSDARRHGRRVLAVVRGSAVNQDGASNGLTAPNGPSQQRVIRRALANAGLTAADVDVVEAHGTGTTLGDPIEAQAIIATYGQDRPADRPLWLGSVKSNIGHTQAAAGAAGLIKMIMAMRHQQLPVTLHVDAPSPHVDWEAGNVQLLTRARPWPPEPTPRRAGISSFGASGTNAHIIIEEPPHTPPERFTPYHGIVPLVVSARTPAALRARAADLAALSRDGQEPDEAAVGWALATTRATFAHRAVVLGGLEAMTALAAGDPHPRLVHGEPGQGGPSVWMFSGQGAQRAGMGQELYQRFPVFAAAYDEVCALLDPLLPQPLRSVGPAMLDHTTWAQTSLFALQVALARLLGDLGLTPDAVIGHSIGEVAAAHVAGVLSLADASRLVAARATLMGSLPAGGAMAAIHATPDELGDLDGLAIAALNTPGATVVSGPADAVARQVSRWRDAGRKTRELSVSHAFHSAAMEPILDDFRAAIADLDFQAPRLPLISNLTGEPVESTDAGYWTAHIRQPVLFHPGVLHAQRTLRPASWVEVGPGSTLAAAVSQSVDAPVTTATLPGALGEAEGLATALARLYVAGTAVDWARWFPGPQPAVALPTYPFQGESYWLTATPGPRDVGAAGLDAVDHPVLPAAVFLPDGGLLLTGRLPGGRDESLGDHTMNGTALVPGAALAEWAVRAGDEVGCPRVDELTLTAPLAVPATGALKVQVAVDPPGDDGRRTVRIYSRPDGPATGWVRHAEGTLAPAGPAPASADGAWPPAGAEPIGVDDFYERAAAGGYGYGPAFQGLRAAWRDGTDLVADVALPEAAGDPAGFGIHPALLDAALHPLLLTRDPHDAEVRLPFAFTGLALWASGARAVRVRLTPTGDDTVRVTVTDPGGAPVLTIDSLAARAVSTVAPDPASGLYTVEWRPVATTPGARRVERAVLGADHPDLDALVAAIEAGTPAPPYALAALTGTTAGGLALAVDALSLVQRWLTEPALTATTLVIATRGAVSTPATTQPTAPGVAPPDEAAPDPAAAAVWGLVRSAQLENPGRFTLLDLTPDLDDLPTDAVWQLVADGETQLAVRGDIVFTARLVPDTTPGVLGVGTAGWHVDAGAAHTVEAVQAVPGPDMWRPLGAGEVRVEVRAAGVNFRDALICLGLYPGAAPLVGGEGAGVVLEVGADAGQLAVGDRIFGVFGGAFAPVVVADARTVVPMPSGWDFEEAAGVPVVFLTAWYALVELAKLRAGESVLVHAGTGGVGMAAIQIARRLGAEVFATASPAKHGVLAELGVDEAHRASSRDAGFEDQFRRVTGGRGVDVVLDCLSGDLVDASLRLVADGGRFLEMGKTDVRDTETVAAEYAIDYRAFDLLVDAGPDLMGRMLVGLVELFESGGLTSLPVSVWPLSRSREALRFVSQARHIGKVVLTPPPALDPGGVVVVTGGGGVLGRLVAEHAVTVWGVPRVVLASRSGPDGEGAAEFADRMARAGGRVEFARLDVTDPVAVRDLFDSLGSVTAVVHAAGVLDDGLVSSLTPDRLERVWGPKAVGLASLLAATEGRRLGAFVVFSSIAGLIGSPGQAAYAAANAYCDALIARRPGAVSIGWGLWDTRSGMTADLSDADLARMARSGIRPMDAAHGLRLLDAALAHGGRYLVAADVAANTGPDAPALLRGRGGGRPPTSRMVAAGAATAPVDWTSRLATMSIEQRERELLDLVRLNAATVLGHTDPRAVSPEASFKELGFDSLTAVELRNRLSTATGLRLPATVVFDYPAAATLADHLYTRLVPATPAARPLEQLALLEESLAATAADPAQAAELAERLEAILSGMRAAARPGEPESAADRLRDASADQVLTFIENELGVS
ncbi:type I polyketide synthase [Phytohabitans houttuyneae]|uniref:Carrier domain-containing protein n=1 Tax=Phytohabitans houttuyneae TaxID=1076126 RepID=A0A6V8KBJ1_9ACTN|nr:type I polyketide synthase [Phytohabitans houttuyneae]GFJ80780.1 hypothetical protein Phou_049600 [Phytohabitans houttuyneae]